MQASCCPLWPEPVNLCCHRGGREGCGAQTFQSTPQHHHSSFHSYTSLPPPTKSFSLILFLPELRFLLFIVICNATTSRVSCHTQPFSSPWQSFIDLSAMVKEDKHKGQSTLEPVPPGNSAVLNLSNSSKKIFFIRVYHTILWNKI